MSDETPQILKQVFSLEGNWESNATLKMGADIFNFIYNFQFKKLFNGQGLMLEERGEIPGVGKLEAANIIGFNPYDEKLHWFTVDNMGTTHDHIGELVTPTHLKLSHKSEKEEKEFIESIDIKWVNDNEFRAELVATLGGEIEEELTGTFHRK